MSLSSVSVWSQESIHDVSRSVKIGGVVTAIRHDLLPGLAEYRICFVGCFRQDSASFGL